MEKTFEEQLEYEIALSTGNSWNNLDKNKVMRFSNIDNLRAQVLSTHNEFLKKDENGNFIPGSSRVITNEEKEMILNYIEENNYPLTGRMYSFLLKSYVNGNLDLEAKEQLRKL